MTKYGNVKTVVDGITFDSKAEAARYRELKLMERAGKISDLRTQPSFILVPGFRKNGTYYRPVRYIADFQYVDIANRAVVVEDVKGFRTDVFKLKKKLFEWRYPYLSLREVKR